MRFLEKLWSRKFGLALGAFITFVAQKRYSEAMTVVLAYVGVEGSGDLISRLKG